LCSIIPPSSVRCNFLDYKWSSLKERRAGRGKEGEEAGGVIAEDREVEAGAARPEPQLNSIKVMGCGIII
jgi:hypothetical protein